MDIKAQEVLDRLTGKDGIYEITIGDSIQVKKGAHIITRERPLVRTIHEEFIIPGGQIRMVIVPQDSVIQVLNLGESYILAASHLDSFKRNMAYYILPGMQTMFNTNHLLLKIE